jgi:hypothetical protein
MYRIEKVQNSNTRYLDFIDADSTHNNTFAAVSNIDSTRYLVLRLNDDSLPIEGKNTNNTGNLSKLCLLLLTPYRKMKSPNIKHKNAEL